MAIPGAHQTMKNTMGLLICAFAAAACAGTAETAAQTAPATSPCTVAFTPRAVSADIRETSGLAPGRRNPGVLWTHNDSGAEPDIFALSATGDILARVRVTDADLLDWEDIEAGPCSDGTACLYIADIGDNFGARADITIYEIAEPDVRDTETRVRRVLRASYPDGAQDAEALFRLPSGDLYIVSKGRHRTISLYRLASGGSNGRVAMTHVREIAPRPADERDRVTAAGASPNGEWVAIRSYSTLFIYRSRDLLGGGKPAIIFPISSLGERQGEAIAIDDDGSVWTSSEAEDLRVLPTFARLTCRLN